MGRAKGAESVRRGKCQGTGRGDAIGEEQGEIFEKKKKKKLRHL